MQKYYSNLIIIGLFILVLSTSCNHKENEQNSVNIKLTKAHDSISFSAHFDSIDITPLESDKNFLLSQVDKKIMFNNNYYFLDKKQNCIMVFDRNGHHKFKIQDVGKGPKEYIKLYDFNINRYTENIELLVQNRNMNIFIYDLKGNYVKSFNLPSIRGYGYFANASKDKIVLYMPFNEKRITIYSRNQKKVLQKLHHIPAFISKKTPLNTGSSPFFRISDTLALTEPFSNKIYSFQSNQLKCKYDWDFGKYNFDINNLPKNKTSEFYANYLKDLKKVKLFFNHIENEKYIITTFVCDNDDYTLIYNKRSNKHLVFQNYERNLIFPTYSNFFEGGIYAVVVNISYLKNYIKLDYLNKNDRKTFQNLESGDNPVVIKYFFKDHLL